MTHDAPAIQIAALRRTWRPLTWKDIAGLLVVLLFVGGVLCLDAFYPLDKLNSGFGPEWNCGGVSGNAPACTNTKKPGGQPHRWN